jgi:ferredoxin
MRDDYQLALVEGDYFTDKLRPKQFLHIDQSECILCEGCVDICPWKCIHYLSLNAIDEAVNVDHPDEDEQNFGFFIVDEDECTRCQLCNLAWQVRRVTGRPGCRARPRPPPMGFRHRAA